jgi:hypothetical protein
MPCELSKLTVHQNRTFVPYIRLVFIFIFQSCYFAIISLTSQLFCRQLIIISFTSTIFYSTISCLTFNSAFQLKHCSSMKPGQIRNEQNHHHNQRISLLFDIFYFFVNNTSLFLFSTVLKIIAHFVSKELKN